jgi:type IV pilus assembly protein PilA
MIVVTIVGILAALGVYGVRKYVANSKTAEATNAIGQIGKNCLAAFSRESMKTTILTSSKTSAVTRALCASAGATVPAAITSVKGKKYQSNPAMGQDWRHDETANGGFACLKFQIQEPQYYMYNYTSDGNAVTPTMGTQFTATANGDLDANGVLSTFMLFGAVSSNQLFLSPNIVQIQPEE